MSDLPWALLVAVVALLLVVGIVPAVAAVGSPTGSDAGAAPVGPLPNKSNNSAIHPNATTRNDSLRFVWLSDFHFDPFYGSKRAVVAENANCSHSIGGFRGIPPIGMFGCDASERLLRSVVRDVHDGFVRGNLSEGENATPPPEILITGDLLRHDFNLVGNQSEAVTLLARIIDMLLEIGNSSDNETSANTTAEASNQTNATGHISNASTRPSRRPAVRPTVHFLGSPLGNNDVTPDYFVNLTDTAHPYFHAVATMLLFKGVMSADEAHQYAKCGFYAREVATRTSPRVTILSLNTVVWSKKRAPRDETPSMYPDPCGQFQWMDEQLTKGAADGNRVFYITGHIPPGINSHGSRHEGKYGGKHFYHHKYQTVISHLLKKHRDVIVGQLFAHTHHFTARLFKDLPQPLLITTGITPVYYNYPSYMVVETDPKAQHRVTLLRQRWLNITDQHGPGGSGGAPVVWQDNSNGPLGIDNSAVPGSVYQSVAAWTHNWTRFLSYDNGGAVSSLVPPCDRKCTAYMNCSVFHYTSSGFRACIQCSVPDVPVRNCSVPPMKLAADDPEFDRPDTDECGDGYYINQSYKVPWANISIDSAFCPSIPGVVQFVSDKRPGGLALLKGIRHQKHVFVAWLIVSAIIILVLVVIVVTRRELRRCKRRHCRGSGNTSHPLLKLVTFSILFNDDDDDDDDDLESDSDNDCGASNDNPSTTASSDHWTSSRRTAMDSCEDDARGDSISLQ